MKSGSRLKRLKKVRHKVQECMDVAFLDFNEVSKQAEQAYEEMQEAHETLELIKKRMNQEYMIQKKVSDRRSAAWLMFEKIKERNNAEIRVLRRQADKEHSVMKKLFSRIDKAYKCGRQYEAIELGLKRDEHQAERDRIKTQIAVLIKEIQDAMQHASLMPKADFTLFEEERRNYQQSLRNYREKDNRYRFLKKEKIRLREEFLQRREELKKIERDLEEEQERIRTDSSDDYDRFLDWAGIDDALKEDAKVVVKNDGTTHIYYGGLGGGDGYGHGHIVFDESGQIVYKRDVFESHGSHNYKV